MAPQCDDLNVTAIFVRNSSDFCMRSDEKTVTFSVRYAQDPTIRIAICEEKFGKIEIIVTFFRRKTMNCYESSLMH